MFPTKELYKVRGRAKREKEIINMLTISNPKLASIKRRHKSAIFPISSIELMSFGTSKNCMRLFLLATTVMGPLTSVRFCLV